MITDVRENRLLVTSDTHVGSLFCDARRGLVRWLDYACAHKYNVCINGDGIEVQYTSLTRFTTETAALLRDIRRLASEITIYYTIGNHDIILEHYLGEWGGLRLVPYLNVSSATKRIRIEHGHLYDTSLMTRPDLRYGLRRFFCFLCRMYPPGFHSYQMYETLRYRYLRRLLGHDRHLLDSPVTRDVSPSFHEAAEDLAQRGFDAVIFGHTHRHGVLPVNGNRARYFNTGSWFDQPHYVVIDNGEVELRPWPS
jgi:UDP-2,3-diacylglucosamine pyrophosphatase LpxH